MNKDIHNTLKQAFGYDSFRDGQEAVISTVVAGRSAAAIFPTGSGKSLCYQLSALHLPHLTLVVSPLLALMQDQLDFLQSKSIPAASIQSAQSREEASSVMADVKSGTLKILMISVERLKNERFRSFISQVPISLLVVDEAHCISEWGHNFRPDYLKLPRYQQEFSIPQTLLLTATATPTVIKDMSNKFAITAENVINTGFYRPNLHLWIKAISEQEKISRLINWLQRQSEKSTIVYVTLQKTAEDVATALTDQGLNARAYHAGMNSDRREQIQRDFMSEKTLCIVATIAFGMGIDKSNIRNVVHYDLPKSIENYSQEIGRAGRDGKDADCLVLANRDNLNVLENFIYGDTPELTSIQQVLTDIKHSGEQWETVLTTLANQCNIRQLPLRTLLVYLEIQSIIKPLYAYYAEFRFKLLMDEQVLFNTFEGERQLFVQAILNGSNKAKTWWTVDFDAIYQGYSGSDSAPRNRVITALEYFNDKQYIQLETKQMTDVYAVLDATFDVTAVAKQLHRHFKKKEASEIERIHTMLALFESKQCISQQLARYFGETTPSENGCGHCSVCNGSVAQLPDQSALTPLHELNAHEYCQPLINKATALSATASIELMTRYLCGITSPDLTRFKARSLGHFGRLEKYPYGDVRAWLEQVL